MASPQKPNILLLSFAYQDWFDEMFGSLVSALLQESNLKRVKTHKAALDTIQNTPLRAIIITDEGLARRTPKNQEVFASVKSYIENGGLVIVGLHFSGFVNGDNHDDFFRAFGLPWKKGDYHRTIFRFNHSCVLPKGYRPESMPEEYSMKASHIKDARETEKMFVPPPDARSQSFSYVGEMDYSQAAVVAASIGEGTLVYCGDVNTEPESFALIMSLCGLNYQHIENRM